MQWQGLRGLTSVLKDVLLWVKCCQRALHTTDESFTKGSQSTWHTSLLYYFKKFGQAT